MPAGKAKVMLVFSLALFTFQPKEPLAAAENQAKNSPSGISERQLCEILVAIAKVDSKLKIIWTPDFSIESGDLKITVKADTPVSYQGVPFQNGNPQAYAYRKGNASDKFYGIELVLHYTLLKGNIPFGNAPVQERITVLYENTVRFKPAHPRAFDSEPFAVKQDGTFSDRQVFGSFETPLPEKAVQVLKQELLLDNELIATVYIMRSPKEIRVIGYSVPPLVPELALQ